MKNDILYVLTEEDAQDVATEVIRRKLTSKEMVEVKKGIESYFGYCWYDVMEVAIKDATKEDI